MEYPPMQSGFVLMRMVGRNLLYDVFIKVYTSQLKNDTMKQVDKTTLLPGIIFSMNR